MENYFDVVDTSECNTAKAFSYESGEICMLSYIEHDCFPASLLDYLKANYKYYYGYSQFLGESYYANHCQNCGVLQGNHFIFNEPDSPFFINGANEASKLTLYRLKLKYDIQTDAEAGLGSNDYLIKKYAQIYDLDNIII